MSETEELSPTVIAIRAIKAEAEADVFAALLDDLEYGNCPGSKLHAGEAGEQTIWLHTQDNIKAWLREAQEARVASRD